MRFSPLWNHAKHTKLTNDVDVGCVHKLQCYEFVCITVIPVENLFQAHAAVLWEIICREKTNSEKNSCKHTFLGWLPVPREQIRSLNFNEINGNMMETGNTWMRQWINQQTRHKSPKTVIACFSYEYHCSWNLPLLPVGIKALTMFWRLRPACLHGQRPVTSQIPVEFSSVPMKKSGHPTSVCILTSRSNCYWCYLMALVALQPYGLVAA